jgi:hypothetical protein
MARARRALASARFYQTADTHESYSFDDDWPARNTANSIAHQRVWTDRVRSAERADPSTAPCRVAGDL